MKKILLAVGLVMASMSWANASTNNSNDVVVVGNGTGSVQVSQCASAWTCNNSSLNVSFEGDVDKVYVDGKATVIKGKDGKDGINGTNGKDGAQGIQGEKGDKGDKGDTGAQGERGEQGIAVGASARFNQNVVTKASVAGTTQSDFVFGAGVSLEW